MALQVELKLVFLFAFLGCFLGSSAKLDPKEAKLVLYGESGDDYVEYTLSQPKDLVNDERFKKDRNTTVFIPAFIESRIKKCHSHHVADAYTETQVANFIILSYGPLGESYEDLEEVDVEELGEQLSDFLYDMSTFVEWKTILLLGYASGCSLTAEVCKDLDEVWGLKLARVSLLDPTVKSQDMVKKYVTAEFVDVIHTSGQSSEYFGTIDPLGLADFFVNDYFQVQCVLDSKSKSYVELHRTDRLQGSSAADEGDCNNDNIIKCSQSFSWEYWAETIRNGPDGPYFCGHHFDRSFRYIGEPAQMGYYCPWTARGIYQTFTNFSKPYAKDKTCE